MASFTRVNGNTGAHGTQGSVVQLKCMEVDALVDISAKAAIGSTIETIVRELQPLIYVSTGTAGKIFMVVDGHGVDAASMQIRLRALGTVDSIVLTSATVTEVDLDGFVAT
jgi:phosphate starvation-inducible protein PhoH